MTTANRLSLFSAFGIELEYMLVDRDTLDVRAVADQVLTSAAGELASDFESGPITWSNELALHVLEIKGTLPTPDLFALANHLQAEIQRIQPVLDANRVMLLPTGMHPWMDPKTETRLWPHESAEIYQAYHKIFDCFSHGWANVQSVHLNLPFADDHQFATLHAATRLMLPVLPALTASSPVIAGAAGKWRDTRMTHVRSHCKKIPFLTGDMIPEPIFDEATYREKIFAKLKSVIEPYDTDHVFDPNFLNARGAIARFDRGSVEIRVMDVQEMPMADIAVCVATIAGLKTLVNEHWQSTKSQKSVSTGLLSGILDEVSEHAEDAIIHDREFLAQFGVQEPKISAGDLWLKILEAGRDHEPMLKQFEPTLTIITEQGSLAARIQRAIDGDFSHQKLLNVYQKLSRCVTQGQAFLP